MKKRVENSLQLTLKIFLPILLGLLLYISCNNTDSVESKKLRLISEKSFVSILTDIYLANGLLGITEIKNLFSTRDSTSTFVDIIESHGYTYEDMSRTIEYYYIKKPKKLINIYDEVLGRLSEMEARFQNTQVYGIPNERNQWKGKSFYMFPDTSGSEKADFAVTIFPKTTFTLTFSVAIYPDDNSRNPCFLAWYCNNDSTKTCRRIYLEPIYYFRDGLTRTYSVTDNLPVDHPVVLKGSFIDFENNVNILDRHARVSDISLIFSGGSL